MTIWTFWRPLLVHCLWV